MTVTLDKKDLISLVKGIQPNYGVFEHNLVKKGGHYLGGFHDKWIWVNLEQFIEEEFFELYTVCKDSWSH